MSRRPLLQLVPTWLPSALLVIAAAAGFWVLSHGMSAGTATATVQGYAEASNVNIVEEMVNLIVAQRAYEINSKSIQTSDEMLQNVANMKR